jgi:hypothetical protein
LGEARIPRIKKEIYKARLNDSTILNLKWIIKRPIFGHRHTSRIDSSLTIEYLSKLGTLNDSIMGTYRFTDLEFIPMKIHVPAIDTTKEAGIQKLRKPVHNNRQSNRFRKQIQIIENGRCYYSDYMSGGPDAGGGICFKLKESSN